MRRFSRDACVVPALRQFCRSSGKGERGRKGRNAARQYCEDRYGYGFQGKSAGKSSHRTGACNDGDERKISINLASRILTLYRGNVRERSYPVGVGKYSTPTPVGYYTVENKEINPTWIDPDDTDVSIPAGGANPLGYRWIGFSGNYGIHGTNRPDTVGHYASNGCVRMRECDVEDLYERVRVGTDVEVYYNRIVIEASPDHTVSYYIYPDGYERQPLTVAAVKQALAGYGVDTFAEDGAVYEKIIASDGNPAYVAKAYDLVVDGKKLSRRALGKDGIVYLPAQVIADAVDTALVWNGSRGMLSTSYGEAPGSYAVIFFMWPICMRAIFFR